MTARTQAESGGGSFLGPYAGSILLHLALFALFGVGWLTWQRASPPEPQLLAIDAVVVDPASVPGLRQPREPLPSPQPPPPAPVAESTPEPVRDVPAAARDDVQERKRAEALQRAADERRAAEDRRNAMERQRAEAARKAADERKAEAARKAEAERKAEAQRKADEQRQRAEREADLRRGLEAEERARAASGAGAQWRDLIRAKIISEWRRPPTARPGIECVVQVTQVPGGAVVAARILKCNGDAAVRQSIELAVMNASPLPPPPDPALFERNLEVVFKPND